jgi:hypothetical protein
MVSNQDYLPEVLLKLGIVVHPLLAKELFTKVVNENKSELIPPFKKWKPDDQKFAKNILFGDMSMHKKLTFENFKKVKTLNWKKTNAKNMRITRSLKSLSFSAIDPEKPAIAVFFGSSWDQQSKHTVRIKTETEYRVSLATYSDTGSARVFIVTYDRDGEVLERKHVCTIRPRQTKQTFGFVAKNGCDAFSVALLIDPKVQCRTVIINSIATTSKTLDDGYGHSVASI